MGKKKRKKMTFNAMEVECMSKDELIVNYLKLKEQTDNIKIGMDFIKERFADILREEEYETFSNSVGEAKIITQKRNTFKNAKAKEFLNDDQLAECMEEKELSFVKIVSADTKEKMKAFMSKKE